MWQFALGVLVGIMLVVAVYVLAIMGLVLYLSRRPKQKRPTTIDLMTYPISHVVVDPSQTTPSKISNLQDVSEPPNSTL